MAKKARWKIGYVYYELNHFKASIKRCIKMHRKLLPNVAASLLFLLFYIFKHFFLISMFLVIIGKCNFIWKRIFILPSFMYYQLSLEFKTNSTGRSQNTNIITNLRNSWIQDYNLKYFFRISWESDGNFDSSFRKKNVYKNKSLRMLWFQVIENPVTQA